MTFTPSLLLDDDEDSGTTFEAKRFDDGSFMFVIRAGKDRLYFSTTAEDYPSLIAYLTNHPSAVA